MGIRWYVYNNCLNNEKLFVRYSDFQRKMSNPRMNRYYMACGNKSRKAMTLNRLKLRLSPEMFTVISCFEVALRNAIDQDYIGTRGQIS